MIGENFLYDAEFYYQQYVNPIYCLDALSDLGFWQRIAAESYENVLELGCGYGRLLSLFAEHGSSTIRGIDANSSMVSFGNKKDSRLELTHGNMCDFEDEKKFDLIFFAFNSFLHITQFEELQKCLSCVKSHLSNNGKLIIANTNISSAMLKGLAGDIGGVSSEKILSFFHCPHTSELVIKSRTRNYEASTQSIMIDFKYHFVESNKREVCRLVAKLYFPLELQFLLQSFGFKLDNVWGDHDRGEFTSNSPEHITVWSLN